MKEEAKNIQVGIAYNMSAFFPSRPVWCDKLLTGFAKWLVNEFFLNQTKNYLDFIGINHYLTHYIRCSKKIIHDQIADTEKYEWPQKPKGILEVIREASKYKKPIYITENGMPCDEIDDTQRQNYLKDVFVQLQNALGEGIDLRGYFYWSLLDNFEWASGYQVKFGLHTIDRKPRKSAQLYKQIINNLVNR
jgi:beta-glucosidase